jgi:hypothetical protein
MATSRSSIHLFRVIKEIEMYLAVYVYNKTVEFLSVCAAIRRNH